MPPQSATDERQPDRPPAAARVPTLTEVVELMQEQVVADEPAAAATTSAEPLPFAAAPALVNLDELVAQVLGELQPRVDMLLETRLREALAPALANAAGALISDARDQLAQTLRELVREAAVGALRRRDS